MISWHRLQVATGIIDTGSKFAAGVTEIGLNLGKDVAANVVYTGGKFAADCQRHRWSTFAAFIVYIGANFRKIEAALIFSFCPYHL